MEGAEDALIDVFKNKHGLVLSVSCKILIGNVMKHGLDEETVRTGNWLEGQAQRVVLDNGAEHALSRSADDTELGGVADTPEGCAAIQMDMDSLEEPQEVQQKELQIAAPEEDQPQQLMCQYVLGQSAEKRLCRRDPGDGDRHQDVFVANRTSSILGYIRRSITGRSREGIFPPLLSPGETTDAVLCPALGSQVQQKFWATGESKAKGHEENS
ncbi:hypothetical protein TURU_062329 [Turdus rufiventris]|nr:hypothetical protein TURU_062329 [Turdus rufiventris]